MIIPPRGSYNGLTLVLSKPSRFDTKSLLTGMVGQWFHETCLVSNGTNIWNCELRTQESIPFRTGTTGIVLFEEAALTKHTGKTNLNHWRGVPLDYRGIPTVATYDPQDAIDFTSYSRDDDADDKVEGKDIGATSHANFMFWIEQDIKRLFRWRKSPAKQVPLRADINPPIFTVEDALLKARGLPLYLDIETHATNSLLCIGFALEDSPVYVVPFYLHTGKLNSPHLHRFLAALAIAMSRNTTVVHHAMFDLFWLAYYMRIPFGREIYDTMLAHARCHLEAEKSLHHCITLWTDEIPHKDQGIFDPKSHAQEQQLWEYNARDIHTMRLIHKAQLAYAAARPGLKASIDQVNSSIYCYLLMELQGINYDAQELAQLLVQNERLLLQYQRCINILAGYRLLATSNKDVPDYLFSRMGYKALAQTQGGLPSCDKRTLYGLKLQHDNPVLDFILAYRRVKKENGMLKFKPYEQPKIPTSV